MSTSVVTPPAAAARVAVSKPSHSVRPGSLTCTWVSTMPGETTRSPRVEHPGAGRILAVVLDDPLDDAVLDVQGGGPLAFREDDARLRMTSNDSIPSAPQPVRSRDRRATWSRVSGTTRSLAPDEHAVLDHQAAARQHGVGGARHLASFVRVVVHVHVQRLRRERDRPVRIEDDDVGVRARARSCPCAGTVPKIFAGEVDVSSTNRLSEMRPGRTPPSYTRLMRVSMPGAPLGIFEKVVLAEPLLLHAERAVVGRDAPAGR